MCVCVVYHVGMYVCVWFIRLVGVCAYVCVVYGVGVCVVLACWCVCVCVCVCVCGWF